MGIEPLQICFRLNVVGVVGCVRLPGIMSFRESVDVQFIVVLGGLVNHVNPTNFITKILSRTNPTVRKKFSAGETLPSSFLSERVSGNRSSIVQNVPL